MHVDKLPKMRQRTLATVLAETRPWLDKSAVASALRQWADSATGTRVNSFGIRDIADELSTYKAAAISDDRAAAIVGLLIANVAAGREYDDYADPFFARIVGIKRETRRRYLKLYGDLAAERWLEHFLHYHHELWARMQAGQSELAARRAMQRARNNKAA
jgi:hypothetical protein